MRKKFHAYYTPTEQDFAQLWQEGIFAFDANMLLNIYRYSSQTREKLFEILKRLDDRIWLPNQAALEYQRDRLVGHAANEAPFTSAAPDPPNRRNRACTRRCRRLPFQTKAVGFRFQPATVSSSRSMSGTGRFWVVACQGSPHEDPLRRLGQV